MLSERNVFKIRGVCFKVTYLMTNQSLYSSFKSNIFLTRILANAPLAVRVYQNTDLREITHFEPIFFLISMSTHPGLDE